MRVGLLQLNPTIGDIDGNTNLVIEAALSCDADLLVTPELVVSGYPPRDLLLLLAGEAWGNRWRRP